MEKKTKKRIQKLLMLQIKHESYVLFFMRRSLSAMPYFPVFSCILPAFIRAQAELKLHRLRHFPKLTLNTTSIP